MIRDIKTSAWQHRNDLVDMEWQETCQLHDYPLANVLGSSKPQRRINRANLLMTILFVLAVLGTLWELRP